jgi:hypothetical protein
MALVETLRRGLTGSPRANLAIALFSVAVIGIAWASRLDRVEVERSQTVADAMRQNANLAIAFEEHTVRTLKGIDQALLFIKHEREEPGSKLDIGQLLTHGIIDDNLFTYIGVVDEQGDLIVGSEPFQPVNLGDREWFKVHQGQGATRRSSVNRCWDASPASGRFRCHAASTSRMGRLAVSSTPRSIPRTS